MKIVPFHFLQVCTHANYQGFSLHNPRIEEVTTLQNADYVWYCACGDSPALNHDIASACSLGKPVILNITGDNCYVPEDFPEGSAFFVTSTKPGIPRQWQVPYGYSYDLTFYWNHPPIQSKPRKYLACFSGSFCTNPNRRALQTLASDSIIIKQLETHPEFRTSPANATDFPIYSQLLQDSYFALCPRGRGVSSQRIIEAIFRGAIPVLLDDDSHFFEDAMDFCLRVKIDQAAGLSDGLKATLQSDMQWRRESMESYKQKYLLIDRNHGVENELGYSEFILQNCK